MDEPQPTSVQEGIVNRLRSRKNQPSSTTTVTPAVTKKVNDPSLKPVKYGSSRTWSK
ncbi:hypothetical protein A2U01_0119149, partial [Trifolium medium]|nr:hypothetical protein [Trifolium medium]